jgi:hypothetical protein
LVNLSLNFNEAKYMHFYQNWILNQMSI